MTAEPPGATLRALLGKADGATWRLTALRSIFAGEPDRPRLVACGMDESDAALIVAAVNAVPGLLDRIDALETEMASPRDAAQADAEIAAWREDLDAVRAWAPACDGVTLLAMLEHRLATRTRAED